MVNHMYYKGHKIHDLVMEAIKFQDGKLFSDFTAIIEDINSLPKKPDKLKAFSDGRLRDLVFKSTGMDIYFFTENSRGFGKNYNAAMYTPQLTKNNPLFVEIETTMGYVDDSDGRRLLRNAKEKTVGTIDLVNCRVGGAFSKLQMRSLITSDLLVDTKFTSGQKAAIMMHEIGHAFTWIEMIAETACFNMALMCVARQLLGTEDEAKRIELALAVNECLNVEVDPKSMAEATKLETWYTVYLKANVEERRKASNSGYYSDTASEFLADQFAVRHGAGKELASAMHYLYKFYGSEGTQPKMILWMKVAFELAKFMSYLVGGIFAFASAGVAAGIGALLTSMFGYAIMIIMDKNYNIYDWDKERISKMRQELINRLKDPFLDDVTKRETLDTIQSMADLIKTMNDQKTFYQLLAYYLNPRANRNVKQRDMQQEIERTVNNDLFVVATKIGTLGQA